MISDAQVRLLAAEIERANMQRRLARVTETGYDPHFRIKAPVAV